ncbi:MAG: polysaccharide biosynthesis/export family protein [Acidobacteria bacterium]|nr:polysaccharide biosynthesis/export family protein [Acidobacteriota bacterium]
MNPRAGHRLGFACLAVLCLFPTGALCAEAPADLYLLGPDDQIAVHLRDIPEIQFRPVRIDGAGNIELPYAGKLRAAGRSAEQLAAEIATRLKSIVNDPSVTVEVTEYGSQPVSVLGAVGKPGVYQLRGRKGLFEVLSLAEGLRPDAGHSIKISRRKEWGPIPLATAAGDPSGEYSVAEVSVKSVLEGKNPQDNILIRPQDVLSVPRAEMVYVVGSVRRAGGFTLGDRETVSVLQAVAMAEGLERTAAPQKARILRRNGEGSRRIEIPVDVKSLLENKAQDPLLEPDDILFVPNSVSRSAALRSLEAGIQLATGVVIWRR